MPKHFIVYLFIIFAFWVFRSILQKAKKANEAGKGQGQGVQNSPQQRQNSERVIHQPSTQQPLTDRQIQGSMEGLSLEEFLVRQAEMLKSQTVQQRANPLSLEQTDLHRRKSDIFTQEVEQAGLSHYSEEGLVSQYTSKHEQGLRLEHHLHAPVSPNDKVSAYDKVKKGRRKMPLLTGSKDDIRRAILLKEILERKF